jgi:hypothetical protein
MTPARGRMNLTHSKVVSMPVPMPRLLLVVVAAFTLASCSGKSSPAPAPTPNVWQLGGTVSTATGTAIVGATVKIMDGANANQSAVTNATGRYTFTSIMQANLTLQVTADGYTGQSQLIALTKDTTVDFALARVLRANLVAGGAADGIKQADGTYDFAFIGRNDGDSCARDISGSTTLSNAAKTPIATIGWTLSSATRVAPGESFVYHVVMSAADAFAGTTYLTTFTFTSTGTATCQ